MPSPFLIGGAALGAGAVLGSRSKPPGRAHFVPIGDDFDDEWIEDEPMAGASPRDEHDPDSSAP